MEVLKSTFLLIKYSVQAILIEWRNLLRIRIWMSSFLNIRSSRHEVSSKKLFLKFWKYIEITFIEKYKKYPWCGL